MSAVSAPTQTGHETSHVFIRPVQPGSWLPCVYCHESIDFVPGAGRMQATTKVYSDGQLVRVEHAHSECQRQHELD